MRAWSVLRQLLAATLCAVLALPACSSAAPLSSSTPNHIYDAETLSKTRVWGSSEKILLHFRAVLLVSEKQHWGYEKCRWENVVGSVVTYDYDAFGNLLHSTATGIPPGGTTVAPTPNEFLFAREQFDPDLHLYYNRARYLNTSTGRFWTMDTFEGDDEARDSEPELRIRYKHGWPPHTADDGQIQLVIRAFPEFRERAAAAALSFVGLPSVLRKFGPEADFMSKAVGTKPTT